MTPLYHLPADDAPLSEWCRPLSATLTTRRTSYFSDNAISNNYGALAQKFRKIAKAQKLRKIAKRPRMRIDEATVCRMRSQGVPVKLIADRLGVDQSGIYRVLKQVKARSDG